jgi:hypothetical protein
VTPSRLGVHATGGLDQPSPTWLARNEYSLPPGRTWIREVDAATEVEAVEKAAAQFKQYAPEPMAVRPPDGIPRPDPDGLSITL